MRAPWRTAHLRVRRFRAGLPHTLGSVIPYFAMIALNAIGVGLFAPFSALYLYQVVGLSLPLAGLGLSVATGCGLLVIPVGGSVIDRFGARPIAIVANVISAVGLISYLTVHSFVGFLLVASVVAIGATGSAIASQALVVDLAAVEERDHWYALLRMASNAGAGAGALLAGALVANEETTGYRWIVG